MNMLEAVSGKKLAVAGAALVLGGLSLACGVSTTGTSTKPVESFTPTLDGGRQLASPAVVNQTVITDGVWVIGEDREPGTYKTNAEVPSGCYWAIYKSGTNGRDIINNDIVDGGRPSVTLQVGHDFKTSGCGAWTKVR